MKRTRLLLLLLALLLILTSCGTDNTGDYAGEPEITGYVVAKGEGDDDLLVVSSEGEEKEGAHETRVFYDALWVYDSPIEVGLGENVRVWVKGGVEESYPGLATAGKVEVTPSDVPEGATLSEAEALRKALNEQGFNRAVLAVQELAYGAEQETWTVRLLDTMTDEVYHFQVEDDSSSDER